LALAASGSVSLCVDARTTVFLEQFTIANWCWSGRIEGLARRGTPSDALKLIRC
jgi:hypothetical protein